MKKQQTKSPKKTVNVRVWVETRNRTRAKADQADITLMEQFDIDSKNNSQD